MGRAMMPVERGRFKVYMPMERRGSAQGRQGRSGPAAEADGHCAMMRGGTAAGRGGSASAGGVGRGAVVASRFGRTLPSWACEGRGRSGAGSGGRVERSRCPLHPRQQRQETDRPDSPSMAGSGRKRNGSLQGPIRRKQTSNTHEPTCRVRPEADFRLEPAKSYGKSAGERRRAFAFRDPGEFFPSAWTDQAFGV